MGTGRNKFQNFKVSNQKWRPQGVSNPRYRRERAVSWASRRWGHILKLKNLFGGARRDRTADLNTASVALSQLSYGPSVESANYTMIFIIV